ncbi:MAG: glycosyltransferase [Candidatus Lernaella stagnicola]|nr:glycosyltransferase [Candidatus Lernaella stagnicola]
MRLAYLIHQDPRDRFGGAEVYAGHLARAARDAGHEVLVICRGDGKGEEVREEVDDGIRYAVLDAQALMQPRKRFRFQESFDNPAAYIRITSLLTDFGADHLHIHHFLMTSAGVAMWARQNDLGVTATLHDYWAFCHRITFQKPGGVPCDGPQRGVACRACGKPEYNSWPGILWQPVHAVGFAWRNLLLRRAYRAAHAVFVPSRAVLEAHRRHGFERANLVYLPYGLPASSPIPREGPRQPLVVGYLGRLAPEKGLETLIDATRLEPAFRLRIAGDGDPDYVSSLRQRAAGAAVEFAGGFDRHELPAILGAVDVVAVPSTWPENLPLAVLEAAQSGTPVLVSDLGGLAETPALCGAKIVAPNTAEAWAAALGGLAASAKAWRELQRGVGYDHRIQDDLAAHLRRGSEQP